LKEYLAVTLLPIDLGGSHENISDERNRTLLNIMVAGIVALGFASTARRFESFRRPKASPSPFLWGIIGFLGFYIPAELFGYLLLVIATSSFGDSVPDFSVYFYIGIVMLPGFIAAYYIHRILIANAYEKKAQDRLAEAIEFEENGKRDNAQRLYEEIVVAYPQTPAAIEARKKHPILDGNGHREKNENQSIHIGSGGNRERS